MFLFSFVLIFFFFLHFAIFRSLVLDTNFASFYLKRKAPGNTIFSFCYDLSRAPKKITYSTNVFALSLYAELISILYYKCEPNQSIGSVFRNIWILNNYNQTFKCIHRIVDLYLCLATNPIKWETSTRRRKRKIVCFDHFFFLSINIYCIFVLPWELTLKEESPETKPEQLKKSRKDKRQKRRFILFFNLFAIVFVIFLLYCRQFTELFLLEKTLFYVPAAILNSFAQLVTIQTIQNSKLFEYFSSFNSQSSLSDEMNIRIRNCANVPQNKRKHFY